MNKADQWLGNSAPNAQSGNVEVRSMDTARLIAQRPAAIVILRRNPATRQKDALPPQTMRVEMVQSIRNASEIQNPQLEISKQYVVLIALRDHPTLPNGDLRRGDQFYYGERMYEVIDLFDNIPGRLLASCELTP